MVGHEPSFQSSNLGLISMMASKLYTKFLLGSKFYLIKTVNKEFDLCSNIVKYVKFRLFLWKFKEENYSLKNLVATKQV